MWYGYSRDSADSFRVTAAAKQSVFLVDDDEAVRASLELLLASCGLDVQAFASAESFLDYYDADYRGCLLLDIRLPGMSGLALQDAMLASGFALPIIFLTAHGDIPTAVDTVKKGALHFVEKPFDEDRLLCLVFDALKLDAARRRQAAAEAAREARLRSLTPREHQVLDMVLVGKTSRVIAEELFVSVKTVEFHRSGIMRKLEVGSIYELYQMHIGGGNKS